MDAELRAGAMGFEEGYVSTVEAVKFRSVSVRRFWACRGGADR